MSTNSESSTTAKNLRKAVEHPEIQNVYLAGVLVTELAKISRSLSEINDNLSSFTDKARSQHLGAIKVDLLRPPIESRIRFRDNPRWYIKKWWRWLTS
jgi:hypothetical protein